LFKLTAQQFGWQGSDKNAPSSQVSLAGTLLERVEWQKVCGPTEGLLKLVCKGDAGVHRFTGFRKEMLPPLKAHLKKHFSVNLTEQPIATDGWSWGEWRLDDGNELRLNVNGKLGVELPVADICLVSAMKNDLNLQFSNDNAGQDDEVLHEMRLMIAEGGVDENGAKDLSAVELTAELQRRKGAGAAASGEALARVADVTVAAPRGKHDLEFFPQSVKIHGKTQNYTVLYRSISRLFLLELPGSGTKNVGNFNFVIGLSQPLRAGQQQHSFLVLNFETGKKANPNASESLLKKLGWIATVEQEMHILVASLFKELSGQTVISPTTDFKEMHPNKDACVRCSVKTFVGHLFPLKKSLICLTKPVIWFQYSAIANLEFQQTEVRRNSFDIILTTSQGKQVEFTQVDRPFMKCLFNFLDGKVEIKDKAEVRKLLDGSGSRAPPLPHGATAASRGSAQRTTRSGRAIAGAVHSSAAKAADDEYDEDADEDAEEEGEDDSSESSVDDDDEEVEPPPKKRAKAAR